MTRSYRYSARLSDFICLWSYLRILPFMESELICRFRSSLPSPLRWTLLSGSLSASLCLLKTYFCSRGLRTGSATECSLPWVALCKVWNTIRFSPCICLFCSTAYAISFTE